MHIPRRHLNYANVVATLALVFAMSGGALAAKHYLINSTKQINPKVLKKLKGNTGKTGAAGAPGAAGKEGSAGPKGENGSPGTPALYHRTALLYSGSATDSSPTSSFEGKKLETIGTFTKLNADSAITLVWTSHATGGNGSTFCQYQLKIDGRDDTGGKSVADGSNGGAIVYGANDAFSVTDVFTGLGAGSHTVSVSDRGTAPSCTDNLFDFEQYVYVLETP